MAQEIRPREPVSGGLLQEGVYGLLEAPCLIVFPGLFDRDLHIQPNLNIKDDESYGVR